MKSIIVNLFQTIDKEVYTLMCKAFPKKVLVFLLHKLVMQVEICTFVIYFDWRFS